MLQQANAYVQQVHSRAIGTLPPLEPRTLYHLTKFALLAVLFPHPAAAPAGW